MGKKWTYRFLLGRFMLVTAHWVVRDIERMITRRCLRIQTTFYDESIFLAPHHINLGYQQSVDVPGDSPADVTWRK